MSAAPISHETPLVVRIARTERSDDGTEELYVVEVTEELDDCKPQHEPQPSVSHPSVTRHWLFA